MTTACTLFFTLPELVALVTPHLSRQDIIHIIRTNRRLHAICTPLLWHSIQLLDENIFDVSSTARVRLLRSPEGLQGLYNNINAVREVSWKANFSWYYLHAVLDYLNSTPSRSSTGQDTPKDMEQDTVSTDELTHLGHGGMGARHPVTIFPLPPLRRLTMYKAFIGTDLYGCNSDLPRAYYRPHQHHTFWLLRLNSSTLVHLELMTLDLNSAPVVRDLCRTLSGLQHLRTLHLHGLAPDEISTRAMEAILFSCSASLEEIHVQPIVQDREFTFRLEPLEGDWDYGQGPPVRRKEPLHRLRTLEIPSSYSGHQALPICSILEHCPALESLVVPALNNLAVSEKVADTIGRHCTHITSLAMPKPYHDNKGVTMMSMTEAIPGQQLEVFELLGYLDYFPDRMIAAWIRHSDTLQRIKLDNCRTLASAVLRTAVINCRALEILELTEFYPSKCCLTLEDAIVDKWACTKIRTLNVPVKLTPNGKNPVYLTDPSKGSWGQEDHAHWEMLGKFYSQIGSLIELRVLDLRSAAWIHAPTDVDPNHMQETLFVENCLPGMLILEDPCKRLGYLSKLVGLTKLQELRGSIVWKHMADEGRMGEQEVDWFVEHLPALSVAHFLPKGYKYPKEGVEEEEEVPGVLQLLQTRRPEISMAPAPYDNDYL